MMNHRGRFAALAVLAATASGCASRIGYITLKEHTEGMKKVCSAKVSPTIKVDARGGAQFYGMAWIVSNQCSNSRTVEIAFKNSATPPLSCSVGLTPYVPAPLNLEVGSLGAMTCLVNTTTKKVYHFQYSVKGADVVVDPDLIIKR